MTKTQLIEKPRLIVEEGENGTSIDVREVLKCCDELYAWFHSRGFDGPDAAIICQTFLAQFIVDAGPNVEEAMFRNCDERIRNLTRGLSALLLEPLRGSRPN
jgi:hypothetical protein